MKFKKLESKKNLLKLQFKEKDEGFLSLVKKYLWQDKATELAGYKVNHPEVGEPVFVLKTKKKSAKKVWSDALKKAKKDLNSFKKQIKKIK